LSPRPARFLSVGLSDLKCDPFSFSKLAFSVFRVNLLKVEYSETIFCPSFFCQKLNIVKGVTVRCGGGESAGEGEGRESKEEVHVPFEADGSLPRRQLRNLMEECSYRFVYIYIYIYILYARFMQFCLGRLRARRGGPRPARGRWLPAPPAARKPGNTQVYEP